MSGKKRAKKGIKSLEKQVKLHRKKLTEAREKDNIGLVDYYVKEIEHFEAAIRKRRHMIMPKKKRKKR